MFSASEVDRLWGNRAEWRKRIREAREEYRQSEEYRRSVLPGNVPTLSVEASSEHGWHRFSHAQIAMTRFGMSGPLEQLFVKFGFDADNVASKGKELVEFYKNLGGNVPDLNARLSFVNFKGTGH